MGSFVCGETADEYMGLEDFENESEEHDEEDDEFGVYQKPKNYFHFSKLSFREKSAPENQDKTQYEKIFKKGIKFYFYADDVNFSDNDSNGSFNLNANVEAGAETGFELQQTDIQG